MKNFFPVLIILFCLGCNNASERMIADIKMLEANKSLATSDTLINSYIHFVDANPEDKFASRYLFKAARASIKANRIVQGARLYERLANAYQNDTLAPEALICAGVAYSTIPDPANAKKQYDLFIKLFPNHARTSEVRKMSEYSGLTEDELLNRFMKENFPGDTLIKGQ